MTVRLTVGQWISHDNMLLSAARFHTETTGQRIELRSIPKGGPALGTFVLEAGGRRAFLDYNDRYKFDPAGADADVYMKRSLHPDQLTERVFPLGFHFNYSHDLHRLLLHPGFLSLTNRTEAIRALDITARTTGAHIARRVDDVFTPPTDNGGRAIFYVRLWNPARNPFPDEQERRRKMNAVRLEAVRLLRAMPNTAAGIIPDVFSREVCPELLLSQRETTSKNYGIELRRADIGIANEGLKGSPGWKIGEYVAGSKAVISNSIESIVPGFEPQTHYLRFEDAREIPDLVADLRRGGRYRAMQEANWQYTTRYLHPRGYFQRILDRLLC